MFKFYMWLLNLIVTLFLNYIMSTKYVFECDMESYKECDEYKRKGYYATLLQVVVYGQRFITLPTDTMKYHFGYNMLADTVDKLIAKYNEKENPCISVSNLTN